MKKILFLTALLLAAMQVTAASVDLATAQQSAMRFLQSAARNGRHAAPSAGDIVLARAELNPNDASKAVYYIFNSNDSYVIISGDDRAREVLAHGNTPLDINNMPCNMRLWLESYKGQIEYLQAHPGMVVEDKAQHRAPGLDYYTVDPLLTAKWDQGEPYNRECPMSGNSLCITGCGATSLSMIFYYWKFPTEPTPEIPAYTTESLHLQLDALPSTTFDWDNMLDRYYGGYSSQQATAVAHLMRYVGQSERMDYAPDGSGTGSYNVLQTVRRFGYDQDAQLVTKDNWWGGQNYTDEEWGALIQDELFNRRPVLMCAYTPTWSGHAFVIDGYDANDDTYHINWGWSGTGDANFALNAFKGGGEVFNVNQQLVIGIEPPATEPTIKAWSARVFTQAYVDSTDVATFTVKGALLTDKVTLTLQDESGYFSISANSVSLNELQQGKRINVTYSPTQVGTHTATVVLTSEGAEDKTITLNGTCVLETYDPVMMEADNVTENSFNAQWKDATPDINVVNYNLEIAPVPFHELRLHEAFDKTEYSGISTSDCSSKLDEITTVPGWTGSKLYRSNNDLVLGTAKSKGWIQTPGLDMYGNNGLVTVKVVAKGSSSDTTTPFKINCGDNDTTITLTGEAAEYTVMLPCPAVNSASVKLSSLTGKRVVLSQVEVLAGDDFSPVDLSRANYINGITGNSYTLTNMQPGYYGMRIQTLYTDGTLSPWSNRMRVFINWKHGDVNHDGEINIADANEVADVIFKGIFSPNATAITDVNGDGEINISDINFILDKIMGN
ncbi:MAG: C10 family peptidase [Muribaculaceae bacterium]|nr:C10 family peptidase [Muribaculaceae bacterium]